MVAPSMRAIAVGWPPASTTASAIRSPRACAQAIAASISARACSRVIPFVSATASGWLIRGVGTVGFVGHRRQYAGDERIAIRELCLSVRGLERHRLEVCPVEATLL